MDTDSRVVMAKGRSGGWEKVVRGGAGAEGSVIVSAVKN